MQGQANIANCVRQIPATLCAVCVRRRSDSRHIQNLTGVILNATQHHQCKAIAGARDRLNNVIVTQTLFAIAWRHFNHIRIRVATKHAHQ